MPHIVVKLYPGRSEEVKKKLADEIGSEAYLNQFENWFKTNTTGSCTR